VKPERIDELRRNVETVVREAEREGHTPIEHWVKTAELLHLLRCARVVAELECELMPELDGATISTAQPDPRGPGVFRVQISGEKTIGEATDLLTATEAALAKAKETPHA